MKYFLFKGVKISVINKDLLFNHDYSELLKSSHYICVTDVGNTVNAYKRNELLKTAINKSYFSLPDGRPLSIYGKLAGIKEIGRTSGVDIMNCIFRLSELKGYTHLFIGDTEEIHFKLQKKIGNSFKELKVKGFYSPPFGDWGDKKNKKIIDVINECDADFIWISFGGGMQEIWMYENYGKINRGIMIGIGAGFRWFIGEIKQAPPLFQKLSLEWFFRLVQQPQKMFKRYSSTLPYFVKDVAIELIKKNYLDRRDKTK